MKFPRKEAKALLAWMQEQMNGETATEWTYGNEHDRMAECADFIGMLVRRESCWAQMASTRPSSDGKQSSTSLSR